MDRGDEQDFWRRIQQIEGLVQALEAAADPHIRASARELVQTVMDLHGAGLDRMLEIVAQAGEPGRALMEGFAGDELVGSLLLLYGLHPVDLQTRVTQALDRVRPTLGAHGGSVELLGVEDGVVRLRLGGSCQGCASSAATLKLTIEEAIYQAAPDLTALEVEGVVEPPPPSGLVQLGRSPGVPPPAGKNRQEAAR